MKDQLIIFDTTMRDGEQSPGAAMTRDEKVRIGKQLERLRVDVIEAGFAASSPGDFDAIRAVAATVQATRPCARSRAPTTTTCSARGEAIKGANSGRVHTFIATSPIHMKHKLRMEPDAVLEAAVRAVKLARAATPTTSSSPPRMRCAPTWTSSAASSRRPSPRAPARSTCPDTVGYSVPGAAGASSSPSCIARIPNADKAVWSTHCHNDLGMAVANSLAAVMAGARQVECTINGLGERAGNASLEEIVMAVKTRADVFPCDHAHRRHADRAPRASWCPRSPAIPCSRTRPWSAPTPSRTNPASTRTACSSTARPTRSCAPRTWAGAPTASRSASSRGAARSRRGCRSSASRSRPRSS